MDEKDFLDLQSDFRNIRALMLSSRYLSPCLSILRIVSRINTL